MNVVGIYGHDGSVLSAALREGALACGLTPRLRSAGDFRDGDTEDFDLAFVTSMRANGANIMNAYAQRRTERPPMPIYAVDYGFLRRVHGIADFETGHWQICLGGLNRLPKQNVPGDRFEHLDLTIHEKGGDPEGVVLICGQHAGDPSHGLGEDSIVRWADQQVAKYAAEGLAVVYRPHPDSPGLIPTIPGAKIDANPKRGGLADALAVARLLVTISSTAGVEALLAGVPAVATAPERAIWGSLSGTTLPSVAQRLDFFNRLAYAQWTLDEMRAGDFYRFIQGRYRMATAMSYSDVRRALRRAA